MLKIVKVPEDQYIVRLFVVPSFQNLEGKILTIIETIGLDEKQENAIKSLIRNAMWDAFNDAPSEMKSMQEFNENIVGSGK